MSSDTEIVVEDPDAPAEQSPAVASTRTVECVVYVLLTGLGEISLLLQEDDPAVLGSLLRDDYGIEEIVFKDGARGALVAGAAGAPRRVPAITIDPKTNAGDRAENAMAENVMRGLAAPHGRTRSC